MLSSTKYFQWGICSGWTFNEYPTIANTFSLCVTCKKIQRSHHCSAFVHGRSNFSRCFSIWLHNNCCNSQLQIVLAQLQISSSAFSSLGLADASDITICSNLFQRSFKLIPGRPEPVATSARAFAMRKFAHNMGIANMRARRKNNHRRIAIQLLSFSWTF